MGKTIRLRFVELVFNYFLKPFEKVVIAQKVLAKNANIPEVRKDYEKAFGASARFRTPKQWNNLVRVYGLETVCKIENMTKEEVAIRCKKFSEQVKEKLKQKSV